MDITFIVTTICLYIYNDVFGNDQLLFKFISWISVSTCSIFIILFLILFIIEQIKKNKGKNGEKNGEKELLENAEIN